MSNNFPLIVNVGSGQIQELPAGDNLDLSGSNISNVGNVTVANVAAINIIRSDNYQYANGSPFSGGGGGGGSSISNGTSNVNIATSDGNVEVAVNGNLVGAFNAANTSLTFPLLNPKNNLFIGNNVGNTSLTTDAGLIAIGVNGTGVGQKDNQNGIAIGSYSADTSQGYSSIAMGFYAGQTQGDTSIAIGQNAGSNQGNASIAIGTSSAGGNQGDNSVAIGTGAGSYNQGINSVAIGQSAGATLLGANSVAIGGYAGVGQADGNTIILNATGLSLNSTQADSFFVKPIRNANTSNVLYYDSSSGEITYDVSSGGGGLAGNATGNINMDVYNLQLRTYEETVYDNGPIFGPSPITFDAQNGTIQKYQLNGFAQKAVQASNMTNCVAGGSYTWIINNQGGANSFGASDFYWAGGSKGFSDAFTGTDIVSIFTPDGTTFYASIVKGFVQV